MIIQYFRVFYFLGAYYDEQIDALEKYKWYLKRLRFKGKGDKFVTIPFQKGAIISIEAIRMLHKFLEEVFGQPLLLTAWTTQDYLELTFGKIRGLGGGYNLHPSTLGYHQRTEQHLIAIV